MGSGVLKTIVVIIFLAALAFVAGSMAADGLKQAVLPTVIVLGGVVLLCMGRHCWILAFILTPLLSLFGIANYRMPIAHFVSVALLAYWLVMCVLGYAKMTWNKVPVIDCTVLIFVIYFLSTWIVHPVTLNMLVNHITDAGYAHVGGAEYIWCISASVTYIFISILPLSLDKLGKMLKWVVLLSLFISIVVSVKSAISPQVNEFGETVAMGEAIQGGRFSAFSGVGDQICFLMFCKYPIMGIICSPWKIAICMVSLVAVAISGFRGTILRIIILCILTQIYHRQFLTVLFCGVCAYVGVLALSVSIPMESLPYGVKRVFSAVPGVEVKDREVTKEAKHSLDWRYEMWEWAMDPSRGYIKDYVWGDGFGLDARAERIARININRRKISKGSNVIFAKRGVWHSGWVTAIHRLGYVGLAITVIFQLIVCFYALRICAYVWKFRNPEYFYYILIPLISDVIFFHYSSGTYLLFFGTFHKLSILKLTYSMAIKEGYMAPMFRKQTYVPMMLQEMESSQRKSEERGAIIA